MKKHITRFILPLLIFNISCKKILDTNPQNAITVEEAQKARDAVYAAVISAYDLLQSRDYYGRDFIASAETLADNCIIPSGARGFFNAQSSNEPGSHTNIFFVAYGIIARANFAIKYADGIAGTEAEKKVVKGEAYFLRALVYFDLLNSYSRNPNYLINNFDWGVPLITDPATEISQITYPAREKINAVYNLVIADLTNAGALLNNSFKPNRASLGAVQALLSRVYLYKGDWANADTWATTAINSNAAALATATEYVSMWGKRAMKESFFELNYEPAENLTTNSLQSIYSIDSVSGAGFGDLAASSSLLASYFPNDIRTFPSLIRRTTRSGSTVHYTRKFFGTKGSFGLDNIAILRISEIYLNRAEARARLGSDSLALVDLNKIHKRATGIDLIGLTGTNLINTILRERRVELAFEGHRIFDLLRLGRDVTKPAGTVIPYTDFRLIARFPQSEIDNNPNIIQNPGY
ncbi:MAG: RagB/SusD family nutrient uptake outer membrane protein [Bacteroidota bacterium]